MEYPPDTLPAVPPGGVTCGIDWANDDHAVCVVDAAGKIVLRFIAEHSREGLAGLVRLAAAGQAPARWRSSAPTARSSRRCWRPG